MLAQEAHGNAKAMAADERDFPVRKEAAHGGRGARVGDGEPSVGTSPKRAWQGE
jgi:hypothetical protein